MVVSMDRWKGKVAIVTGSSSGIGAAVAKQLVEAGMQVVGVARRKERLEELAKSLQGQPGKLHPFQGDVTKEADILSVFQWTKSNLAPVSVLINNAGIGRNTSVIEGETSKWKEVIDTNVMGLCIATREAVKMMRENKIDGHIVNVNSILGHQALAFPGINVYPASKHAVTALTETVRHELNNIKSKIKITSISPGTVETEIRKASGFGSEMEMILAAVEQLKSEDIADAILYALSTPPRVQIKELIIKPVGEPF